VTHPYMQGKSFVKKVKEGSPGLPAKSTPNSPDCYLGENKIHS